MARFAKFSMMLTFFLLLAVPYPGSEAALYDFSAEIDWTGLEVTLNNRFLTNNYIEKNTFIQYSLSSIDKLVPNWTNPITSTVSSSHLSSIGSATAGALNLNVSFDNQVALAAGGEFYVRALRNGLLDIPENGLLVFSVPFSVELTAAPQGAFPYDFAWVRSSLDFERLSGGVIERPGVTDFSLLLIDNDYLNSKSASGTLTVQQQVVAGETWWLTGSVDTLIKPSAVPELSTLWLFGIGLAGLAGVGWPRTIRAIRSPAGKRCQTSVGGTSSSK